MKFIKLVENILQEVRYEDAWHENFVTWRKSVKKKYNGIPDNIYVQFTDNTSFDKLDRAIYMDDTTHGDPSGVYAYPLKYVFEHPSDIWYGFNSKYMRILKDVSKNPVYLQDMSDHEASRYISRIGMDYYEMAKKWKKLFGDRGRRYKPGQLFFRITQIDWKKPLDDTNRPVFLSNAEQNKLFRTMGIDCMIDRPRVSSTSAINSREPLQTVFLTRYSYEVEDVISLSGKGETSTTNDPTGGLSKELQSKLVSRIAQEVLGDNLKDNKPLTTGLGGWAYYWTNNGSRIEFTFNYERDRTLGLGEKKHKANKLYSTYSPSVVITSERGVLELDGEKDESYDEFIDDLIREYNKLEPTEDWDWEPETEETYLKRIAVVNSEARKKLESEKDKENFKFTKNVILPKLVKLSFELGMPLDTKSNIEYTNYEDVMRLYFTLLKGKIDEDPPKTIEDLRKYMAYVKERFLKYKNDKIGKFSKYYDFIERKDIQQILDIYVKLTEIVGIEKIKYGMGMSGTNNIIFLDNDYNNLKDTQ